MVILFKQALLLSALLFAFSINAQQPHTRYDSALKFQEQGKLNLARTLLQDTSSWSISDRSTAKYYLLLASVCEEQGYLPAAWKNFRKSLNVSSRAQQRSEMALSLNGLARMATALGRYDSVIRYLNQSRNIDTTAENRVTADQAESKYWQSQNQYDQALSILQQALDQATRLNDENSIAIILSNMGSIYFSHNPDMQVALEFYQRSNHYLDSLQPSATRLRNYCRIANGYMVMGNLKKAEEYLLLARQLAVHTENLQVKAYALSSWAILLAEQGHVKEAAEFFSEPIRIKRILGDNRQLQNDLLNAGEMYMKTGQHDRAKKLLTEGVAISHDLHDIIFLKYFYQNLSDLDSLTGNYASAYSNLKKSFAYRDSSFSVEHLRAVNEIKVKYEAKQKEKIIAEKELQIKEQKYQRAILLVIFTAVVLTLIIILILVRSKNRNKLQNEKQLRLHTIVQTQEEVQQRIARDLHDGLVQVLGAAQMALETVRDTNNPIQLQKQMHIASGILDEAVMEARSISHQVLPYSLLKGGLSEALEELLSRSVNKYTFHKTFDHGALNENEAIAIYRIVQELINNVLKHANANHVTLTFAGDEHEISLSFEDDGNGFTHENASSGVGLSNIKTRAEMIGGTITYHSRLPQGTRVNLRIRR